MKQLILVALTVVGACVPKEEVTTGPTVTVTIESTGFGDCRSDLVSGGSVEQEDMMYTLSLTIDASPGKTESTDFSTDTEYHPVTKVAGTLTVPNVTIPESPLDVMDTDFGNRTFTRHDPIVLPASAMGQVMQVTLTSTDSEGLAGNKIDFGCMLD